MSLDVYLEGEQVTEPCRRQECDHEHERTRRPNLYWANITHNLNRMAGEAGIYEHLWRPDEIGITTARQLIEPLHKGLVLLRSDPARFRAFDAPNGWGLHEHLVSFVAEYLAACEEYPDATVRVSR